jgi:protein TonB
VEAKEGANYLKNPRPAYPHLAKRENWQGTVVLRVRVFPTGRAGDVTVQKSSGHSVLDDAALDAAKVWTFVPATQAGQPVAGWVTVPIEFRLQ